MFTLSSIDVDMLLRTTRFLLLPNLVLNESILNQGTLEAVNLIRVEQGLSLPIIRSGLTLKNLRIEGMLTIDDI